MQRGTYLPIYECEDGVYIDKSGIFFYFECYKGGQVILTRTSRFSIRELYDYIPHLNIMKTYRSLMLLGAEDGL